MITFADMVVCMFVGMAYRELFSVVMEIVSKITELGKKIKELEK